MRTARVIFLLAFALAPVFSHGRSGTPGPLKVSISPGEAPHTVNCRIQNTAGSRLEFWSWYCSYTDEWKTDAKSVFVTGTPCDKNYLGIQFLEPGQSREWKMALTVAPKKYADTEVFRMSFTPSQPTPGQIEINNSSLSTQNDPKHRSTSPLKGIFWSNGIRINSIRQ
jgi:hypothetical protein